jgi:Dihaem cytochrome c
VRRLVAFALLSACACAGGRPRGPMSDAERTYLAKCTACHSAYEPSDHTPAEWRAALDEMERLKRVRLSSEERAAILSYLTSSR